jgi:hypothetical protein
VALIVRSVIAVPYLRFSMNAQWPSLSHCKHRQQDYEQRMLERAVLVLGGLVGSLHIVRGFINRAAVEDGSIRRDERPVLYWTLMALAVLVVGIFFYSAAFGDFS